MKNEINENKALSQTAVSGWRMFEATVTLKDGTIRTYISSTLGGEEEAKKAAINNDWSSLAVDAVIALR